MWPATARGWEQPVCSPGAGSGIRSPNRPGMPELKPADRRHPRRLPSHRGGEKERAKLQQEFLVQVLQASRTGGPVTRLIGAATAPGTQPAQRLDRPAEPATVKTPGTRRDHWGRGRTPERTKTARRWGGAQRESPELCGREGGEGGWAEA